MNNEFVREARYIIFKISDIKEALSASEIDDIQYLHRVTNACRERLRKKPLEGVVVESDWPEYEPTWRAIEARVTGAPYPGMSEAFEHHFSQPFKDGEWHVASRTWAAAWKAAKHHARANVPDGWLRAIDEALVVTHLGVANADDSYEDAKRMLNGLIGWHTGVATDPAVNGGFKLVPADAQPVPSVPDGWIQRGMAELEAIRNRPDDDTLLDDKTLIERIGEAMLAAAPEVKT